MNETGTKRAAAVASILLGAALWGIIGIWNRALMARGLSPVSIVLIRNFGGMVLLVALCAARDRSVFSVKREHLKYFFGTGIVSVLLFTVCYFSCQRICSLSVASILLYTAPVIVVLLSAAVWREKITARKIAALVLTLVGCACVCGVFSGGLSVTLAGVLFGLGAGFFYALYSIFGRFALGAGYSPLTVTVWTFLFAGVGSLALVRPAELASAFSAAPVCWGYAAALVVFSTVLPYLFYTKGLQSVEARTASILATLEPVVASLVGTLLYHEPMNAVSVIGILCVLAGVAVLR